MMRLRGVVLQGQHLRISDAKGNSLSARDDGLYVPEITGRWASGLWNWKGNSLTGDPGTGNAGVDAPFALARTLFLNNLDGDGRDRSRVLQSLRAGDQIGLQDQDDASSWAKFVLTSVPQSGGTYWSLLLGEGYGEGIEPRLNDDVEVLMYHPIDASAVWTR